MLETLHIAANNEKILSGIMKDHDNGIEEQVIDNRSLYEKRDDSNYMRQQFEKKVYDLFNNDSKSSDTFVNTFNTNLIPEFNVVYPQLVSLFKGSLSHPSFVLTTTNKLINNLHNKGVINQSTDTKIPKQSNKLNMKLLNNTEEIKKYIFQQYQDKNLNKKEGNDIIHILNAMVQYNQPGFDFKQFSNSAKWAQFKKEIQPNIDDLVQIISSQDSDADKLTNMDHILKNIKNQLTKSVQALTPAERENIKAMEKEAKEEMKHNEKRAKANTNAAKLIAEEAVLLEQKAQSNLKKAQGSPNKTPQKASKKR